MAQVNVPKVLIAFAIYDGYRYCIDAFLEHLSKFDFPNYDVFCVDNSDTEDFADYLRSKGLNVFHFKADRKSMHSYDIILESRKIIRKYFLEHNYDYLMSLDCDVMAPANTISKLLSHDKDIVTGVYIFQPYYAEVNEVFPLLWIEGKAGYNRQVTMEAVLDDKLMKIKAAGWGCVFVKRNVLEEVDLRRTEHTTEDVYFYVDAQEKGFTAYADTSVKCFHMAFPEGDPRNNFFKWENHLEKRNVLPSFSYSFS